MKKKETATLAIGLGPSNLSLGALATSHPGLDIEFVERKARFDWYEGLLLPFSSMQSSFVRDLVTPVDPTNSYSFLSYLHQKKRLHHFLAAHFTEVPRFEFNGYLKWAANRLPNASFGECVNEVHHVRGAFEVHTGERVVRAKNLVLGIGNHPHYPARMLPHVGEQVFHGLSYCRKPKSMFAGKRVAVIGGGQTGAEIVLDLYSDTNNAPRELAWISRRPSFTPMEDSPFLTEVFSPGFSEFFYALGDESKRRLLGHHRMASDGISPATLATIYQSLYLGRHFEDRSLRPNLMIDCDVPELAKEGGEYVLTVHNRMTETHVRMPVDIVVLCTGLEFLVPSFLYPIKHLLSYDEDGFATNEDFSVRTTQPIESKVYVQNGATMTWGVSDRNLVMSAWRSAKILNSLLGRTVYELGMEPNFQNWSSQV